MTHFTVHALPAGDADPCAPAGRQVVAEGPVYIHADGCDPHRPEPDVLPELVDARRTFSVRAYDADAMLLDAEVVPADLLADRARALLGNGAAFLHAHFAGPGCFAFRIERAA